RAATAGERITRAHLAPLLAIVGLVCLFALQTFVVLGLWSGAHAFAWLHALLPSTTAVVGLLLVAAISGALLAIVTARWVVRAMRADRGTLALVEETLRQREEFLALAAHELKTPLTAVLLELGAAQRIAGRAGDTRVLPLLARAERASRRLATLVDDLLLSARADAGLLPEEVDLAELARAELAERGDLFRRAHCEVALVAEGPVTGHWDPARVRRALASLLSNAAKYGQGHPIEVIVDGDAERARLAVRDHGIGIEPERFDRIFERFGRGVSSRHYGGLGLGLWLTRREAEALGGTVRVESRPGDGALFTLELPRGCGPAPSDAPARATG
ncbi:MAG TPA: HAMP domain-containing sensor histidine kinase, partial [Anaeromyxobacteraceae bacterium]|nr:HAMP domain-containing sensor histidine kinase [Anaeromyxobacteraceae bacterium]